jgi:hypothetical protein
MCEPWRRRARNTERGLLAGVRASETAPGLGGTIGLCAGCARRLPAALCLKAVHSGVHALQDGFKVINPHGGLQATLTGEPVRHRLRYRRRLLDMNRFAGSSMRPSRQGRRCLSRRGKERVLWVPGRRRNWGHRTRRRQRPRAGSRSCGPRRGPRRGVQDRTPRVGRQSSPLPTVRRPSTRHRTGGVCCRGAPSCAGRRSRFFWPNTWVASCVGGVTPLIPEVHQTPQVCRGHPCPAMGAPPGVRVLRRFVRPLVHLWVDWRWVVHALSHVVVPHVAPVPITTNACGARRHNTRLKLVAT